MNSSQAPRRFVLTAVLLGSLLLVASCANAPADPGAVPRSNSTEFSRPATTSAEESPAPLWEANLSDADMKAYRQALARWEAYERSSEPIWAAGEATPAARELFEAYFTPVVAESAYRQLETYEAVDVQISGTPDVFWSKAVRVSPTGDSVVLRQCVDFTTTRAVQDGGETVREARFEQPLVRDVELGMLPGANWIIYAFDDLADEKVRTCDPDAR